MTPEKIKQALNVYRIRLQNIGIKPYRFPPGQEPQDRKQKLMHVAGLIEAAEDLLKEDRLEKAFRWLGFVQGALWASGLYTIKELKDHNRPDDDNQANDNDPSKRKTVVLSRP